MNRNCIVFAAGLSVCFYCSAAKSESFELKLRVKTSNIRDAETNDQAYIALHYLNRDTSKPKVEWVRKQLRLDNLRKNDRQTGALDSYSLRFDFPPSMLRKVEIGIEGGNNAWHLEGIEYTIEYEGKTSRPTAITINKWLSGEVNDVNLKGKATSLPYYIFEVKPPVFKAT